MCQPRYDLVFKRGHVIDPANQIDGVMDVAVAGGKSPASPPNIPAAEAKKAVDANGLYVTPGLIDLHAHVFGYSGSIFPDDSAHDRLHHHRRRRRRLRLAHLRRNADAHHQALAHARARPHQHRRPRHDRLQSIEDDTNDMDSEKTAAAKIAEIRQCIVGIKTAHFGGYGWTAIDRAVAAGNIAKVPVMVDDKIFTNTGRTSREKLLEKMRPGDMHTHIFNDRQLEVIDRFNGKVQPYILEARKRGVLFDLGHGAAASCGRWQRRPWRKVSLPTRSAPTCTRRAFWASNPTCPTAFPR